MHVVCKSSHDRGLTCLNNLGYNVFVPSGGY